MVQSTRGPRAREDILLVERCQGNERGGITYFPVGDTFVSSETLLKKAPPFTSNWAVGFAIVCVLCVIMEWGPCLSSRATRTSSINNDREKETS